MIKVDHKNRKVIVTHQCTNEQIVAYCDNWLYTDIGQSFKYFLTRNTFTDELTLLHHWTIEDTRFKGDK